jgi:hypothetical protein
MLKHGISRDRSFGPTFWISLLDHAGVILAFDRGSPFASGDCGKEWVCSFLRKHWDSALHVAGRLDRGESLLEVKVMTEVVSVLRVLEGER